jgi:hypothetical protein
MSSEMIVALILTVIAVAFVIWVRTKSHGYEEEAQIRNPAEKTYKE